jgi:hypothetical protein
MKTSDAEFRDWEAKLADHAENKRLHGTPAERDFAEATLGAIADVILAHRPKSRQPQPRKRKKAKRRATA